MTTSFDTTLAGLGISRPSAVPPTNAKGSASLGQADFLALMTAQLKNQDPFDPVDNTQMVAQMAQFSSLAGITEMSGTLKAIADKLGAVSATDAMAYVGRAVLVEGEAGYPMASGVMAGTIELDADATDVDVRISGPNGELLKTVQLGARPAGSFDYEWDGVTDAGEPAGAGPFTVRVTARDGGETVAARSLVWAPVSSVALNAGGTPILTIPGIGQVPATAVRKVG